MKKFLFGILTFIGVGLGFGNAVNFSCSNFVCSPSSVSVQPGKTYKLVLSSLSEDDSFEVVFSNGSSIISHAFDFIDTFYIDSSVGDTATFGFYELSEGVGSAVGIFELYEDTSGGGSTGTIPDIPGGNEPSATPPTPYNGNIIELISGATVQLSDSALASGVGEPMFFWYGQLLNAAIKFFPVIIVVSMFRLIYGYLKNLGNKNSLESKKSLDNK